MLAWVAQEGGTEAPWRPDVVVVAIREVMLRCPFRGQSQDSLNSYPSWRFGKARNT